MSRIPYTSEQRKHALDLYGEHGAAEAGRLTGINPGTIRQWAAREGVTRYPPNNTEAATAAARLSWEQRRSEVADEMGTAVVDAVRLVKRGLKDGIQGAEASMSTADLKNYATVAAIFADKAQLLTGGATARSEHALDPRDRVGKVRDQLADRRARGAA